MASIQWFTGWQTDLEAAEHQARELYQVTARQHSWTGEQRDYAEALVSAAAEHAWKGIDFWEALAVYWETPPLPEPESWEALGVVWFSATQASLSKANRDLVEWSAVQVVQSVGKNMADVAAMLVAARAKFEDIIDDPPDEAAVGFGLGVLVAGAAAIFLATR